MTTHEQLGAEAEELYPTPADPYTPHEAFQERAAHVRAKTVSAAQLEAGAAGMWDRHGNPGFFQYAPEHLRDAFLKDTSAAFKGAGLIVEGEL